MNTAFTILLVDDETNILKALHRLLRPEGYRILTAESGADALAILARESVDLVVSDMRMPEMDGAVFLAKVRQTWPDTVRLLLTGHADMAQTVSAINQGEIYRFIAKPWNDQELIIIVRQALDALPQGPVMGKVPKVLRPPAGEVYHRVENPRGELGFYLVSDGTVKPYRVHIRRPSFVNLQALDAMCRGMQLADSVAAFSTIDPLMGEVDC